MPSTAIRSLTTAAAIRTQNRLTRYLKRLREKDCLTQSQMAERLGIKSTTYYNQKIERLAARDMSPENFNKLVHACDVLDQFGKLERMDYSEFACYLKDARQAKGKRWLFPWERDTLAVLSRIDGDVKANFASLGVSKAANGRMTRFEQALDLVYLLLRMDAGSFKAIAQMIHAAAKLNKIAIKPVSKTWLSKL